MAVLNDGVIPKGNVGGDGKGGGKYAAVKADVSFFFNFDQVQSFSKVVLDYQNWDGATKYGTITVLSSADGLNWIPYAGNINTRNGLNREPLTKEIDLASIPGMSNSRATRAPGTCGPILGEVSFYANTGSVINVEGSGEIFANASQPYSFNIPAAGATSFTSNLPNWITLNAATGQLTVLPPQLFPEHSVPTSSPVWIFGSMPTPLSSPSTRRFTNGLTSPARSTTRTTSKSEPLLVSGVNGHKTVQFDGVDGALWTSYDFDDRQRLYHLLRCPLYWFRPRAIDWFPQAELPIWLLRKRGGQVPR